MDDRAPDPRAVEVLLPAVERAAAAWPDVDLDPARFATALSAHLPPGVPVTEALKELHVADLYLAWACAEGDSRAIAHFDRLYLAQVSDYVMRVDRSPAFAADVRQHLAEELLVARPDRPAGVARYAGRGPLGAYVRLAAVRKARYLRRGRRDLPEREPARGQPIGDVELDLVKRRYGPAFEDALAAAMASLDADLRALLKMHFLDGMKTEAIGVMLGVNKSTITRRLARARQQVFDEARRRLAERLDLDPSEADSLVALLQSRVDVTMRWFLDPT